MTITPMKTLTVAELREALEHKPGDLPVRVWLPGSRVALSNVMGAYDGVRSQHRGMVLIEGNIEPGSALDN